MKKIFPYILIVLIVVQLLVPFTVGVGVKNNLEVKSSKAEAADGYYFQITEATGMSYYWPAGVSTLTLVECQAIRTSQAPGHPGATVTDCTNAPKNQTIVNGQAAGADITVERTEDNNLACTIIPFKPGACIAQGLYWLFFKTTSVLFGLAGKIMDFTLKYSLDDTSYRSSFVVEGWGLVRDFCNMFFIFILLYVAFGTILNLQGVKTKEMIIRVVIIGLLINFSLFATQVIIDTSNILARVFYNQNTIVTGTVQKDAQGNPLPINSELGDFGEIQLSSAIVSKIDPQKIVLNSQGIGEIPTKNIEGGDNSGEQQTAGKGMSVGTFILIIFITTAVNIVGMLVFLSCAFIFVGRVVMLWLAMILAPLAFFSYTVPAMQDWGMVGWKKWWPETLKMAFVAPVFAFFMYLIVGFMDKGLNIVNAAFKINQVGLSSVVAVVVPFIFIVVLLLQAKRIAVSMSGEVGAALSKVGATVGGVGLAAVTGGAALAMRGTVGGAALAMRGTVGRLGNKLATSKFASTNGAVGRAFGSAGKWASAKSFDLRATKLGASAGKGLGVDMGKAKEGGYAKHLSEKVEKRQKRAKELEVHESEPLKQALNKTENDLQALLNANKAELDNLDKTIEVRRQALTDANIQYGARSKEAKIAGFDLQNAKRRKTALRNGNTYDGDLDATGVATTVNAKSYAGVVGAGMYTYVDVNGITKTEKRTINNMETYEVKDRKRDIENEDRKRKWAYAKAKSRWGGRANKEAAHRIRMEAKLDSGDKH